MLSEEKKLKTNVGRYTKCLPMTSMKVFAQLVKLAQCVRVSMNENLNLYKASKVLILYSKYRDSRNSDAIMILRTKDLPSTLFAPGSYLPETMPETQGSQPVRFLNPRINLNFEEFL